MGKDNSLFEWNGKTYKLVRKPDSFGCTEICPLALANKGNCEALCSEAFLNIESPEFRYYDCMFAEVTETENKETTMKKDEIDYKALYEQEHKKYGDAVERMKSWMNGEHPECFSEAQKAAEFVFPELRESEDEKMIKFIANELMCLRAIESNSGGKGSDRYKELINAIAWIEKQSEQKPVIIIPKFRIGDRIKTANEEPLTITEITDNGYWSEDLFICNFDDADKWELVEQKPTWSEEDEDYYDAIITKLEVTQEDASLTDNQMDFLKSLKNRVVPQNTWKPTEEQMKALKDAAFDAGYEQHFKKEDVLESLIEDLKKL